MFGAPTDRFVGFRLALDRSRESKVASPLVEDDGAERSARGAGRGSIHREIGLAAAKLLRATGVFDMSSRRRSFDVFGLEKRRATKGERRA